MISFSLSPARARQVAPPIALVLQLFFACFAAAETAPVRIAFWHTELSRDGPGLFLRDVQRGTDQDILDALDTIEAADADILVLQGIDWDLRARGLTALAAALANRGAPYPYRHAIRPNRGTQSGLDLNGNGRLGDPQDAIGYGLFTGQNGLSILSRHEIHTSENKDFSAFLWADLPGALLPYPGMPDTLPETLPLSTTSHSLTAIELPDGELLWVGTFAATTPVFDGPEDRNGRRNHDEVLFWTHLLDGSLDQPAPKGLVIAGNANLDPSGGDGRRAAIRSLLAHPELQDTQPAGDLGSATVDFGADSAGALRVAYLLPDRSWRILGSGTIRSPSHRHRLIWADLLRQH